MKTISVPGKDFNAVKDVFGGIMLRQSEIGDYSNLPSDMTEGGVIVVNLSYFTLQFAFRNSNHFVYYRNCWGSSAWSAWRKIEFTT